MMILTAFFYMQNSSKYIKASMIYILTIIISNLNSTKNIVYIIVPIFLSLIIYNFIESDRNIKQMLQNKGKQMLYIITATILGTGIAFIIFHFICVKVGLTSIVAGNTFSPLDQIGENVLKLINSLVGVYGASDVSKIISFQGGMHVVKLLYAFLCIVIVPFYTIKSYKKQIIRIFVL